MSTLDEYENAVAKVVELIDIYAKGHYLSVMDGVDPGVAEEISQLTDIEKIAFDIGVSTGAVAAFVWLMENRVIDVRRLLELAADE